MLNKLKNIQNKTSEEGFTLIELMIVVVIIGILAAIAVPIFMNQQKAAISATVKSDVKNAVTSMATESVKLGGKFPKDLPDSTVTSDGVVLSLKKSGPLATSPTLSVGKNGRMSWAEFEKDMKFNTNQFSAEIIWSGETTPVKYWYPMTGGNKQDFLNSVAELCADTTQDNTYCIGGVLVNPEQYDTIWQNALLNGILITVKYFPEKPTRTFPNPAGFNRGGFGKTIADVEFLGSRLAYYNSGELISRDNAPAYFPQKTEVDPVKWGTPGVVDPSRYCLEGYHESAPEMVISFDSNVGKIREGKC